MKKILIIDDEAKLRALLARLTGLEGYETIEAGDGKTGLKKLVQHADIAVVLCDVKLPDGSGVELVQQIKTAYPLTEVILLTAYGNIADGVQAIKNGAFDYLVKGDDNNKIIPLLHRAAEKSALARRVQQLESRLDQQYSFERIIGASKVLSDAIHLARKVAGTDTAVLLTGETGTGKEVFAQAIHQESGRRLGHFVAVNCSAFGHDLLESEMFGHRAGAFTGAIRDKKGLFEEANGGTIFLDEIGEMAPDLQAKLLRVLELGEFMKVGDTKTQKTDARVIAATNRDLQQEIAAGRFRADLYYRISVFQILLPPLRERIGDIEPLIRYFAAIFAAKTNQKLLSIDPDFVNALCRYHWPGNIRELKNIVERGIILMEHGVLSAANLPIIHAGPDEPDFDLANMEKHHIRKVLHHTNGNKTKAAELLGIALTTLYRKLEGGF